MATRPPSPVTLAELTAGLVWPRLLRAPTIALAPSRMALGFLFVALCMGVGTIFDLIAGPVVRPLSGQPVGLFATLSGSVVRGFHAVVAALLDLDLPRAADRAHAAFITAPLALWRSYTGPAWALFATLLLVVLPVWCLVGGAIARSVAAEVAVGMRLSTRDAFRFALARWRSLIGAAIGPVVLAAVLAGAVWLNGKAMGVPIIGALGGVIYGLLLLLGFLLVLLAVGFLLGQPLLLPAVSVERTDALDAVQRAYAYTIGRPGRMLLYLAVLLALAVLAYAVASWIVALTINWTADLAAAGAGERAPRHVRTLDFALAQRWRHGDGLPGFTVGAIGVWERLLLALLASFVVSFYFTGSTLLYLLLRRVNDEQDVEDIGPPEEGPGGSPAPVPAPRAPAGPVAAAEPAR